MKSGRKQLFLWGLGIPFLVLLFFMDLALGSVELPFSTLWEALIRSDDGEAGSAHWIVREIRFPRSLCVIVAGIGLSLSGLQMQTLFRNPLAGPSVLGINSGATLGVALLILAGGPVKEFFMVQDLNPWGNWSLVIASMLGSGLILFVILLFSHRLKDPVTLLVLGVMIGQLSFSLVSIWQYFSDPGRIKDFLIWSFGDPGGVTNAQLPYLSLAIGAGALITFLLQKDLDRYLLGETYARSMGSNIRRTRIGIILSTSLMTGAITAFCGPIGFIGIAIPHMTRALLGSSRHGLTVPGCLLIGPVVLLLCDIIAQLPGHSTNLPISAVTSLIGAPLVIGLILQRKELGRNF